MPMLENMFYAHVGKPVSMSVSEACPHAYVGKTVSIAMLKNMFLCPCQKACLRVRAEKPAVMSVVGKHVSIAVTETLFPYPFRKANYRTRVGKHVYRSIS